jgi:hypothetical protein
VGPGASAGHHERAIHRVDRPSLPASITPGDRSRSIDGRPGLQIIPTASQGTLGRLEPRPVKLTGTLTDAALKEYMPDTIRYSSTPADRI